MICYKDMTFCPFYSSCDTPCYRSLTPKVVEDAEKFGLPTAQFMGPPDCYKHKVIQHLYDDGTNVRV